MSRSSIVLPGKEKVLAEVQNQESALAQEEVSRRIQGEVSSFPWNSSPERKSSHSTHGTSREHGIKMEKFFELNLNIFITQPDFISHNLAIGGKGGLAAIAAPEEDGSCSIWAIDIPGALPSLLPKRTPVIQEGTA